MPEYQGPERRKPRRLSDEELKAIKEQVLDSIEADLGKRGFTAIVWLIGLVVTIFLGWLSTKIHIKLDP
jgi:hypothetical protein